MTVVEFTSLIVGHLTSIDVDHRDFYLNRDSSIPLIAMITHLTIDIRILDPLRRWIKLLRLELLQKVQQSFSLVMHSDVTSEEINNSLDECNGLASAFRAPFLAIAGALIIAKITEQKQV